MLEHLSLADAVTSAVARRFFPLVERENLIQVAREALLRSVLRCKAGELTDPYQRLCISGALQHHLRDRVRLVRIPRRLHEQGQCPLGHISLDGHAACEPCLLDQLASPERAAAGPADDLALEQLVEQLVEQLPAAQATALRLTILEGLSLRPAAEQLHGCFDSTLKLLLALLGGAALSRMDRCAWERELGLLRASPVWGLPVVRPPLGSVPSLRRSRR